MRFNKIMQESIDELSNHYGWTVREKQRVKQLMDENVQKVAIDFMNKCLEHFQGSQEGYVFTTDENGQTRTVEELFDLYKEKS